MKEVKQAADELATAYFNSTSFINTLTDKNEDWIASQLKAVGVENAEALAHNLKIKSMIKEDKLLKTAFDLFENNIKTYILQEYCMSSGGEKYHYEAIDILKMSY